MPMERLETLVSRLSRGIEHGQTAVSTQSLRTADLKEGFATLGLKVLEVFRHPNLCWQPQRRAMRSTGRAPAPAKRRRAAPQAAPAR